jgi:hypothetical protein
LMTGHSRNLLAALLGLPKEHSEIVGARDKSLALGILYFLIAFYSVFLHILCVGELLSSMVETARSKNVVTT